MRKDSVTYIIAKSGIPEIMVDLLRTGISDRGKKPILASLGMLSESFVDVQTAIVKMGVLGPVVNMLWGKCESGILVICFFSTT